MQQCRIFCRERYTRLVDLSHHESNKGDKSDDGQNDVVECGKDHTPKYSIDFRKGRTLSKNIDHELFKIYNLSSFEIMINCPNILAFFYLVYHFLVKIENIIYLSE